MSVLLKQFFLSSILANMDVARFGFTVAQGRRLGVVASEIRPGILLKQSTHPVSIAPAPFPIVAAAAPLSAYNGGGGHASLKLQNTSYLVKGKVPLPHVPYHYVRAAGTGPALPVAVSAQPTVVRALPASVAPALHATKAAAQHPIQFKMEVPKNLAVHGGASIPSSYEAAVCRLDTSFVPATAGKQPDRVGPPEEAPRCLSSHVTKIGSIMTSLIADNDRAYGVRTQDYSTSFPEYFSYLQRHFAEQFGNEIFVIAFLYIERLQTNKGVPLHSPNAPQLLLGALTLAAKFHDNEVSEGEGGSFGTAHFSALGGVEPALLRKIESEMLELLEWNVWVPPEHYQIMLENIEKCEL